VWCEYVCVCVCVCVCVWHVACGVWRVALCVCARAHLRDGRADSARWKLLLKNDKVVALVQAIRCHKRRSVGHPAARDGGVAAIPIAATPLDWLARRCEAAVVGRVCLATDCDGDLWNRQAGDAMWSTDTSRVCDSPSRCDSSCIPFQVPCR
jgi:hypothetical protein